MAQILKRSLTAEEVSTTSSESGGLLGFNLSDFVEESQERLRSCQEEIKTILAAAEAKATQIKKNASELGYQEGTLLAQAEFEQCVAEQSEIKAREEVNRLQEIVGQLQEAHENWMAAYSETLPGVAISIAERIVKRELNLQPELMINWAREAIASTRSSKALKVILHPDALEQVGDLLDRMLCQRDLPEKIEVCADPNVGRHEILILQEGGEIHAGLNAQLEQLGAVLK
ncbi:FliH/SctL family protein [bacterium]|nr:FliH/SctL family protein [bacterium]